MANPFIKLENPIENCALVCRGCLAESGEMKNMFEWGLTEDFFKLTNVQVLKCEGISELLCVTCEEMMDRFRSFQQQCQSANIRLKVAMENFKQNVPQTRIETITTEENTISSTLINNTLNFSITAPNAETKIFLPCMYCKEKYIKKRDLALHLTRHHDTDISINLLYYCNFNTCSYNKESGSCKHFTGRKFLNQHYNKIHKPKIFSCDTCCNNFSQESEYNRHFKSCNATFTCPVCIATYKKHERLLVHLLRKHPDVHKRYIRKGKRISEGKKIRNDEMDFLNDSPKRSLATQTKAEENIKNDVALLPWVKNDLYETKTDEISTQTVFEDLLSLKSQNSEDDSIFFSETVSLSDIHTQTFPLEFGLNRLNKETLTSETQSPDLSIKETQTCYCLYDSPKLNFKFDSVASSPSSTFTSTGSQTAELRSSVKSDVMLSFNSAETQTSFEESL